MKNMIWKIDKKEDRWKKKKKIWKIKSMTSPRKWNKKKAIWGPWVAHSVKRLPSAQFMILGSQDWALHLVPCSARSPLLPLPLPATSPAFHFSIVFSDFFLLICGNSLSIFILAFNCLYVLWIFSLTLLTTYFTFELCCINKSKTQIICSLLETHPTQRHI